MTSTRSKFIESLNRTRIRRHGEGFKKDREEGSKNKKKNISLAELRKEGPRKEEKEKHGKSAKSEGRKFKGGNRKERRPKDPASRKERLDKEMERYWIKGGHKE